jgi:hypothetical protein
MTFLIKLDEDNNPVGHPVDDGNFRALFPLTQFPLILTPASVENSGFALYEFSQIPKVENRYEKAVEGLPKKAEDGRYLQTWEIVPMNEEEKSKENLRKCAEVRHQRNIKLQRTDWTQLNDTNVDKTAWKEYRKALRDVPSQAGFPWNVQWPEQP